MSGEESESGQLVLGGFGDDRPTDRLFFALFPDASTAVKIGDTAEDLREKHGLRGKPLRADRFHVTLHHLGDFPGDLWRRLADQAIEAAAQIWMPVFDVAFDSASSFATRKKDRPFVLRSGDRNEGLHALHAQLGQSLRALGNRFRAETDFVPHVTLLYDERLVLSDPVERISWPVREFFLVRSLLGRTVHERLASWPLQPEGSGRPPN